MRFMPTSITAAPGLIQSPSTRRGRAHGRHQDVRAPADLGEVPGARVADGDGRVARSAAGSPAGGRPGSSARRPPPRPPRTSTPALAQQLHHALRRARDEAGAALGQQPRASRGQPVDVLGRVDRRDHGVLVDAGRGAGAGRGSRRRRRRRSAPRPGRAARPARSRRPARGGSSACRPPRCCLRLLLDVDVRGGVVADQHRGEPGNAAVVRGRELLDVLGDPRRGPRRRPPCRR